MATEDTAKVEEKPPEQVAEPSAPIVDTNESTNGSEKTETQGKCEEEIKKEQ